MVASIDYRALYDTLQLTIDSLHEPADEAQTLATIVTQLIERHSEALGVTAARIYRRDGDGFAICHSVPANERVLGLRIPADYAPVRELLACGFVVHRLGDPEVDRALESAIGVTTFAGIAVGTDVNEFVAFSLADESDPERVVITLNTIRHVMNLKLRKDQLEETLAQARAIQLSLLPKSAPRFADYDVWAQTHPAEEVGGDLYDYIHVNERSMGFAIADAAGHGLPAALQARDAIIGLRMSVEERWRITATIEKLNTVIGRSAIDSRFIAMFYAEVDRHGTLVYCNAGHQPPLLYSDGTMEVLREGGMILGPNPAATYERGYRRMAPGAVLVACTDGIVEAERADGESFDMARLREVVRDCVTRGSEARAIVEAIFAAVRRFSRTDPPVDDQTVLVVRRGVDQEA